MGSTYFARKQYFKIYSVCTSETALPLQTNGDLYLRFQLSLPHFQLKTNWNSTFKIHTSAFKSAVPSQGLSKILWATEYCLALLMPNS